MQQRSLFETSPDAKALNSTEQALTVAIAGTERTLTKGQKVFNRRIAQIAEQRKTLAKWRAYVPTYFKRFRDEVEPLNWEMRAQKIGFVEVLDRALDGKALSKTQRDKAKAMILAQLDEILEHGEEIHVVALFDKYSEVSFADQQQDDVNYMRAMAANAFGFEVDGNNVPTTPEEMAELIEAKLRADAEAAEAADVSARAEAEPPEKKYRSSKAAAQHAAREKAAEGATRSLREVYRRLVSALHPDREPDLAERKRKTELMQQVNVAYETGDLLALLELQLSIEQIDPDALATLADERLTHFNAVLKEQSERLDDEIFDIMEPFIASMRRVQSPEDVEHDLDASIVRLRNLISEIKADIELCQDVRELKTKLNRVRSSRPREIDPFEDMAAMLDEAIRDAEFFSPPKKRNR